MLLLEMMFRIPKTEKTSPIQTSSPFSTETKPPAAEKKPLIRGNKKKPVNLVYVGGEKHDKVITYINIFTAPTKKNQHFHCNTICTEEDI